MSKLRATITWDHQQKSNSVELSLPDFLENTKINWILIIKKPENLKKTQTSKKLKNSGEIEQEPEEFVESYLEPRLWW